MAMAKLEARLANVRVVVRLTVQFMSSLLREFERWSANACGSIVGVMVLNSLVMRPSAPAVEDGAAKSVVFPNALRTCVRSQLRFGQSIDAAMKPVAAIAQTTQSKLIGETRPVQKSIVRINRTVPVDGYLSVCPHLFNGFTEVAQPGPCVRQPVVSKL